MGLETGTVAQADLWVPCLGHTLTQKQKTLLKSVERLALAYYAPMWKTTPTASLQIILNQKPSHLEVLSVGIRSYIWIKNLFQNNFWDGIPNKRRMHSHLTTLKHNSYQIIHEGTFWIILKTTF